VLLTTYGTLASDDKSREQDLLNKDESDQPKEGKPCILDVEFLRVVLDDAHELLDQKMNFKAVMNVKKAVHHWCLTGTPILNKKPDDMQPYFECKFYGVPINIAA
jgi:SWI/SNF-related matrix-associated actin-dependent regulator of chromatin subfamily A3